ISMSASNTEYVTPSFAAIFDARFAISIIVSASCLLPTSKLACFIAFLLFTIILLPQSRTVKHKNDSSCLWKCGKRGVPIQAHPLSQSLARHSGHLSCDSYCSALESVAIPEPRGE